jgi:hypothetical protein
VNPGDVLDRLQAALAPGGVVVMVEWARERFDQATARWTEDRLPPPGPDASPGGSSTQAGDAEAAPAGSAPVPAAPRLILVAVIRAGYGRRIRMHQ